MWNGTAVACGDAQFTQPLIAIVLPPDVVLSDKLDTAVNDVPFQYFTDRVEVELLAVLI
jgi:hypothetical protein